MLPSVCCYRYFKCPFYFQSSCNRPYCHFNHSEAITTKQEWSTYKRLRSGSVLPANLCALQNVDEEPTNMDYETIENIARETAMKQPDIPLYIYHEMLQAHPEHLVPANPVILCNADRKHKVIIPPIYTAESYTFSVANPSSKPTHVLTPNLYVTGNIDNPERSANTVITEFSRPNLSASEINAFLAANNISAKKSVPAKGYASSRTPSAKAVPESEDVILVPPKYSDLSVSCKRKSSNIITTIDLTESKRKHAVPPKIRKDELLIKKEKGIEESEANDKLSIKKEKGIEGSEEKHKLLIKKEKGIEESEAKDKSVIKKEKGIEESADKVQYTDSEKQLNALDLEIEKILSEIEERNKDVFIPTPGIKKEPCVKKEERSAIGNEKGKHTISERNVFYPHKNQLIDLKKSYFERIRTVKSTEEIKQLQKLIFMYTCNAMNQISVDFDELIHPDRLKIFLTDKEKRESMNIRCSHMATCDQCFDKRFGKFKSGIDSVVDKKDISNKKTDDNNVAVKLPKAGEKKDNKLNKSKSEHKSATKSHHSSSSTSKFQQGSKNKETKDKNESKCENKSKNEYKSRHSSNRESSQSSSHKLKSERSNKSEPESERSNKHDPNSERSNKCDSKSERSNKHDPNSERSNKSERSHKHSSKSEHSNKTLSKSEHKSKSNSRSRESDKRKRSSSSEMHSSVKKEQTVSNSSSHSKHSSHKQSSHSNSCNENNTKDKYAGQSNKRKLSWKSSADSDDYDDYPDQLLDDISDDEQDDSTFKTVPTKENQVEYNPTKKRRIAHSNSMDSSWPSTNYTKPLLKPASVLPSVYQTMAVRYNKSGPTATSSTSSTASSSSTAFIPLGGADRPKIASVANPEKLMSPAEQIRQFREIMKERQMGIVPVPKPISVEDKNPNQDHDVEFLKPKKIRVAYTPKVSQSPVFGGMLRSSRNIQRGPVINSTKPHNNIDKMIRQRGLDELFTVLIDKLPPELAAKKALEEEEIIHNKVRLPLIYNKSILINAHRLEKEDVAKLLQKKGVFPNDFYGISVYDILKQFVLSDEQYERNGYPMWIPGKHGCVRISRNALFYTNVSKRRCGDEFICLNCKDKFSVDESNFPIMTAMGCRFHLGRLRDTRINYDKRYLCCGRGMNSHGCVINKYHALETKDDDCLEGFKSTKPAPPNKSGRDYFALDCEMVYTTVGCELARVTVVTKDAVEKCNYFVNVQNPILDYATRFSGLSEEVMNRAEKLSPNEVRAKLMEFIFEETILIGHSLENDLVALKMYHRNVVDTSVLYPHALENRKHSLKDLASANIEMLIQSSLSGHDSLEDARAAMLLVQKKVKEYGNSLRPRIIIV